MIIMSHEPYTHIQWGPFEVTKSGEICSHDFLCTSLLHIVLFSILFFLYGVGTQKIR